MPNYTPMMQQYLSIKAQHKDSILMFRLGDFFEIFFEDAKTAASELNIALTGRECGMAERAPMCGVPAHAVDGYVAKLVEKGYRVALCDQVEDAKQAKGIVKREVVRIITPGTITDAAMLEDGRHNYIAAIHNSKSGLSLAAADITTGLFITTVIGREGNHDQRLLDELSRLSPAEIIVAQDFHLIRTVENLMGFKATIVPEWTFHPGNAQRCLTEHFRTMHLEGFGLKEGDEEIPPAGALITYLADTQKNALSQITRLKPYMAQTHMTLDGASRRNLELTRSSKDGVKKGSLLWVLDKTKTPMGARMLRNWIDLPLVQPEEIAKRQSAVEEWKELTMTRAKLREYLQGINDLERIMSRLASGIGTARDLAALKTSLGWLPPIGRLLEETRSHTNNEIRRTYDDLADIYQKIDQTIMESPPATLREGGMIKSGVAAELDKLRNVKENAQEILTELETREKKETGITSLKVRYNKVFGYYIEVTASNLSKVPEGRYVRKQTLANCERYITEELKELEDTLLAAEEKIINLEYELFDALRREVVDHIARIQFTSYVLAGLDGLQSLAEVAERENYVKPQIANSGGIYIREGRHPVVEQLSGHAFVPNDTELDSDSRLAIITGPNMAGKSTYMRQVALIVLMAQMGSFVPAAEAMIGVVDRIFTRVGASDDLATGQSTFMVEMTETANILNNATSHSLVLLDEIGRGTSTFDGLAIAWAVLEHIADVTGAKTLFATHYHELTQLGHQIPGVVNYCFTAQEKGDDIVFLRQLVPGEAGQSYGIHVARLAGLPRGVLDRAWGLHGELVKKAPAPKGKTRINEQQLTLATDPALLVAAEKGQRLIQALGEIEIDKMTPLEALVALGRIKELISQKSP